MSQAVAAARAPCFKPSSVAFPCFTCTLLNLKLMLLWMHVKLGKKWEPSAERHVEQGWKFYHSKSGIEPIYWLTSAAPTASAPASRGSLAATACTSALADGVRATPPPAVVVCLAVSSTMPRNAAGQGRPGCQKEPQGRQHRSQTSRRAVVARAHSGRRRRQAGSHPSRATLAGWRACRTPSPSPRPALQGACGACAAALQWEHWRRQGRWTDGHPHHTPRTPAAALQPPRRLTPPPTQDAVAVHDRVQAVGDGQNRAIGKRDGDGGLRGGQGRGRKVCPAGHAPSALASHRSAAAAAPG